MFPLPRFVQGVYYFEDLFPPPQPVGTHQNITVLSPTNLYGSPVQLGHILILHRIDQSIVILFFCEFSSPLYEYVLCTHYILIGGYDIYILVHGVKYIVVTLL